MKTGKIKTAIKIWNTAFLFGVFTVMSEVGAYAQNLDIGTVFSNGATEIAGIAKRVLQFLEVLVGMGAAVLIGINFLKRKDGEGNANEGIVSWAKGLIYTLLGFLFVEKVLLKV